MRVRSPYILLKDVPVGQVKSATRKAHVLRGNKSLDLTQQEDKCIKLSQLTFTIHFEVIMTPIRDFQDLYVKNVEEKFGIDQAFQPTFDCDSWYDTTGGFTKGRLYEFGKGDSTLLLVGAKSIP
ncbi:hypothetical protein Leryth_022822 [Lithospermum erythrorhizon]|nr:hypothetical protein Leryth_022822 [Lithospermum erythrorhizon]